MQAPGDELLRYYLEELSYLREMGERFSRSYPKVAGRLELQSDECPDPHVERLIESFAFLTARIQSSLDADFPEIAAELLNVLYPHYLNPVPSMAVAKFDFDRDQGKLTSGFEIPRHTKLFAHADQGQLCRMRTAYPVTLWPIEVSRAVIDVPERFEFLSGTDAASVLRLRLDSRADPFEVLEVDSLRFYLHGEPVLVGRLYELLTESLRRVVVLPVDAKSSSPRYIEASNVVPVGFGEEDEVVPYARHSHPAHRLLQEYFSFPDKFHFFDVRGLKGRATGTSIDLLFLLDRVPRTKLLLMPETFSLGCTPVVNLFRKSSEPIRVDHRQTEYRLVGDMRKERTTEVHSILSVSGSADSAEGVRDYAPFYSFTHGMELRGQKTFWHARRVASTREDMPGTEMLLSFRDLDFRPARPPHEVVYAQLLCTNRALATELPAGAVLSGDEPVPATVVCLKKPTRPLTPPLGGQTLWRLISHLSLNYLSLGSQQESVRALHEILNLYCFSDAPSLRQQVQGIRSMNTRKISRRLGGDGWKGFCRGTEITLEFEEAQYVGSSASLLAAVLSRFFALYGSMNSFTQLVSKRFGREGEKRWPPMAGAKSVL